VYTKSPSRRYDTMGNLIVDLKRALTTPYDDFVSMVPFHNQDKTRVIEDEDVKTIKKHADYEKPYEEEEYADEPYDDEAEENYEDDKELLNPKMEKAVTIMGIVAAVIIVLIIFYLLGSFFGLFNFGSSLKQPSTQASEQKKQTETVATTETETANSDKISMIDIKGKTYDEAKAALSKIGLGIFKNGVQASDDYKEGQVATQSVNAGDKVSKNTIVKVVLSSGATSTTIPDVSNTSADDAKSKLTTAGFKVTTDYAYSDTVAQGNIASSSPAAGAAAKKGDTVTIYISRGSQGTSMPNLEGQTQDSAVAALNKIGITNVQISSEYNNVYSVGKVVGQNVTPGTMVAPGTSVTIAISKGSKTYSYSGAVPNDDAAVSTNPAKSATVTILDSTGKKLMDSAVYNLPANANISISNITTPTGTMSVYWTLSDGSVTQVTNSNLNFSQNN